MKEQRKIYCSGKRLWWLVLIGMTAFSPGARAASVDAAASRAAMQLLKAECFSCHNGEKHKGGLVLSARERLLEGGDSGAVIVPGKPDASLLVKALGKDADPHMPPKKQLTDAQVKTIREWVKRGAAWNDAALIEEEPVLPVRMENLPAGYLPVMALALSPDEQKIAVGRGGRLVIHEVGKTNFPVANEWSAGPDAVQALAWSSDGRRVASGSFRRVALWNAESAQLIREWTNGLAGRIAALEFAGGAEPQVWAADSVDGRSGHLRVFSAKDGRLVRSWRAHEDTIFDLDRSRDGSQVVSAGGDKLIKIWDVAQMKEVTRLEGHAGQVLAVAFNTNATQVASGGADKELKVWDVKTREKIIALGRHVSAVTAVAWPGEGRTVAATTDGGAAFTYKNLKAHTGEQSSASGDERRLGDAGAALFAVAATKDGSRIFAGGFDGSVSVWNAEGRLLTRLAPGTSEAVAVASVPPVAIKKTARAKTDLPKAQPVGLKSSALAGLNAEPRRLALSADAPTHGVLISASTGDGFEWDVTGEAKFSAERSAPFEVTGAGTVRAIRSGEGKLFVKFKNRALEIPIRVMGFETTNAPAPASFLRDVLPALSRAGCNAGPCHAKPEGQNGFKLSVFSYEPKADYHEIVRESRGRRIFPAAPAESLLLKKATTTVPHEGGLRFEKDSETYQLLVRWMREGMAYSATNEPALQRIEVFPKNRRYKKSAMQRLLVQAHYSDGSVRDVTRLAAFDSNDKEIAKVDERGVVRLGGLAGQGVIVARYMGFVADSQVLVPAERQLTEADFASLPRSNFIDEKAYENFRRLGLLPSETCTDAEFLRRAKLDAIGLMPTLEEVRAFLDDKSPDKRRRFIARVLEEPAYADYWANKWADLLRPNPDRVGVKSVFVLDQWLRESFRQNKPYDQFVREILLAEGSNHRDGPAVIYRDRREPPEITTMFTQLFLGTRFECAKCHHHPNEKWSQEDFYQFAAYFGPVRQRGDGLSPPISGGRETFYFSPGGRSVKHPVTGEAMTPRPPEGTAPAVAEDADPRRSLAGWLTAPENPFFARAAVNRVWAVFFGRGLVEPVDDFRISNPCVNPPLLDALAADFAAHGYDFKHLMRTIMESRLYQLSSTPNDSNLTDTRNFSRAYRRRLPAEVLMDAINDLTGVPDTFSALPAGSRATQAWTYKIDSQLMDAFSRPNPSSDPPCERDQQMSVVQSLHLMNSKALQAKLGGKNGRAGQLAASSKSPGEIVTELYLATLGRPPSDDELKAAVAPFHAEKASRQTATEDVFWALLNSAEFVFNH